MATKKASKSASKSAGQDNSALWKWIYVAGVVVASVAAALGWSHPILSWVLLLAGLAVGFFYFDSADVQNFGLRYVILYVVVTAGMGLFAATLGSAASYVTGFFQGFFNFLGPVVLAQIITYFVKKYFSM